MKTIKLLSALLLLLLTINASAQFTSAEIGVDGLTCSACTRSVEMSIRKLSFVDSVAMNLEHTEGRIFFKKNAKVEMDKVAKAVIDAGFSLRSLTASVNVNNNIKASNDFCWVYENNTYHFVKVPAAENLNGSIRLKFIGDKYMSKKELKDWKMYMTSSCSEGVPAVPSSKNYYVSPL